MVSIENLIFEAVSFASQNFDFERFDSEEGKRRNAAEKKELEFCF